MIESRNNETLKAIRRLRRRQGDQALLEGPHLVGEALEAGLPLESVLVAEPFAGSDAGRRLLARLSRPPLRVEADLLASLADADSPRGCLAVARLPRLGVEAVTAGPGGVHLYLDGLQDPGNLGALARVGEALAVRSLVLGPGCAHPNHPRALRASAGSLLRLPVALGVTPDELDRRLEPHRPVWVALVAHGGSLPAPPAAAVTPLVLALGAEGPGLSAAVERRADRRWTLPLAGPVESLNVTVAAALALWELRRQSA